ncbi:thioredoxin family protein [Candidatus Poribacteria bacterium]|nr:thioredoxin family protein [Candidatus Poribacteria bacterium]
MKLLTRIFTMIFIFIVAFSVNGGADTVKMDKEVPNFTLKDAMDKEHSLKDLSHEKKATVVMFISTQCPVSNHYNERIVALHNDYKDQGVQFIGINSNKNESVEEIAEHNKTSKFDCVVLKDLRNEIADKFGARRTPEVYLLDEKRRLRYRGAIDNSQKNPETHYLRETLDLVVAGKEIPEDRKKTKAFGCTIKRVRKKQDRSRTP